MRIQICVSTLTRVFLLTHSACYAGVKVVRVSLKVATSTGSIYQETKGNGGCWLHGCLVDGVLR